LIGGCSWQLTVGITSLEFSDLHVREHARRFVLVNWESEGDWKGEGPPSHSQCGRGEPIETKKRDWDVDLSLARVNHDGRPFGLFDGRPKAAERRCRRRPGDPSPRRPLLAPASGPAIT
jgi:hypothetical protein